MDFGNGIGGAPAIDPAPVAQAAATLDAQAASAPATPKIVDFDAGGSWGSRDLPLKFPFKKGGVVYDKLTFREPSGFDIDTAMRAGASDMVSVLLVNLSAQPASIFDVMHGQDRSAAVKLMGEFLGA